MSGAKFKKWKTLQRRIVLDSEFLKVYQDTIKLPNGEIIDDYTLIKKPDIVMIVATTADDRVIFVEEYEHGAGCKLLNLPAGHIFDKEDPIETAKRELAEETGFGGGKFTKVDKLYEYPSKDIHTVTIVKAEDVVPISEIRHEITEMISIRFIPRKNLKKIINKGDLKVSSALASLALAGLLF